MDEKVINSLFLFGTHMEIAMDKLNETLLDLESTKESIDNFEKKLREKLLDCMLKRYEDYNSKSLQLNNYTISLVSGNSKEEFDSDKFVDNEDIETLALFTEFNDEEVFDLDIFKKENPEMYKKYTKTNYTYTVDTKKLSKSRPDIYEKYVTILPSTKKPTIMIKSNKDK